LGFNKKFVPALTELRKELARLPSAIENYWQADSLVGPSDSIKYIESLYKSKNENQDPEKAIERKQEEPV
jgi:hypothetical protein